MYANKLAVAIKVNNRVLREQNDTVYIPFGSEYSLLIKNLNSKRAIVKLSIDGNDMLSDGLVINAGESVDLERSIVNGNLTEGNRFKFIERTEGVEKHRGIQLEDGLVRVEFQFEKTPVYYTNQWYGSGALRSMQISASAATYNASLSGTAGVGMNSVHTGATCSDFAEQSFNDTGITVPGSVSNQKFSTVSSFPLEDEKHVMILKLLGETPDNKIVTKPVTVHAKPKCTSCGHQNKATANFCVKCGTGLRIVA